MHAVYPCCFYCWLVVVAVWDLAETETDGKKKEGKRRTAAVSLSYSGIHAG